MSRTIVIAALLLAGCGTGGAKPTTQPMSAQARQDAALRDPMNYKPPIEGGSLDNSDPTRIDSPGLNRDLNNVLNP